MRPWVLFPILLVWSASGCVNPAAEKVHDFTEDGIHLYNTGDYFNARESFQAALALKPGDPDLLYNVAQCYDRSGKDGQAERFYTDCLKRAPKHAECRHALTALMVRQGRWGEATTMVHDWLKNEPQSATAYAEDAWLWRQYGDLPKARARVEEALVLDPQDNRALLEKAQIYELLNRPDRAVFLYEQALRYHPNQPAVASRIRELRTQGAERPHPD
jgi:Flp pilus assembly protein TadD